MPRQVRWMASGHCQFSCRRTSSGARWSVPTSSSMVARRSAPESTTFARTSPQQKTLIVQSLNASGRHTLMCGDGTNDVGSLKAATVGIALTNKEKRKQSAAEKQQNKRLASPFYWPSP